MDESPATPQAQPAGVPAVPLDTRAADAAPAKGPSPHTKSGHRKMAVLGLMLGMLLGALDNTIVVTVLPNIVRDLHNTDGLPFVVSAYLIAQTIAMPIFGKLSDTHGRRAFFILGLVVFMIGSVLSGIASTLDQLIVFRAIQGVGSGAFFPVANSIIGVIFDTTERARLTGAFSAIFGISAVLGPLIGSTIVEVTTWHWIFFINLPIGVVSYALVMASLGPLKGSGDRPAFDWRGAALLAAWVAALMLVLEQTGVQNGWKWTDPLSIAVTAAGLALLGAFLWWELRVPDPVVPLRHFKVRVVAAANGMSFMRGFVFISALTYVSIFVAFALGGSAGDVRNTLYGFLVPMVIGAAVGGTLLPKMGYRPLIAGGMALMAFGALLMTFVGASTPAIVGLVNGLPAGVFLFLAPVGFGIGMTFAPAVIVVQTALPRREIGISTSMVQFMLNIGGAFGVSIMAAYQQARFVELLPTLGPQGAAVESIHGVFVFLFVAALIAIVPALFIKGRISDKKPEEPAPLAAG
jgi:EmrB/QacA subfamily drug resistance transporter